PDGRQPRQFDGQPLPGRGRTRGRPGAGRQPGGPRELHVLLDRRARQLDQAVDLVHRRALEPHRARDLSALPAPTRAWLEALGFAVADEALWAEALTHGSTGEARDYERLEFLGDRVLGLSIADWLYANER